MFLPKLFVGAEREPMQAEVPTMRLLSELFRLLLISVAPTPTLCGSGSFDDRYFSSTAFIVMLALRTFDTGHPALAFSAAF